jgi:hypothetical protein
MKYVEQGGDVRATSANTAYMGVVFQGKIDDAIAQARAAPDHGVPELSGRAELLTFLRVKPDPAATKSNQWFDLFDTEDERDSLIPALTAPAPGFYTLAYAQQSWPQNFVPRS